MNLPFSTYLAFAALAGAAAASDIATRRIPNWVAVALLAGGVGARAGHGTLEAGSALAAALLVAAGLLPLWRKRFLGGGDLKIAAGAAAWVGLGSLPGYFLAAMLAGGVLAVASYAASGPQARVAIQGNLLAMKRFDAIAPPLGAVEGRVPVAAGAAFAAGAAWVLVGG